MAQITARLSPSIRDRFDRYAAEVGLDASELARLLITREMHVRRLEQLAKKQSKLSGASPKYGQRKLAAHFHRAKKVAEFGRYAVAQRMSRAAAARAIVEWELHERWLVRAFAWSPKKVSEACGQARRTRPSPALSERRHRPRSQRSRRQGASRRQASAQ
jgi:hypothetical protein